MEPRKVFVFDLPLFQMTGRYINWRHDLTDRNIFSGEFWLTAKLCSGHWRLTAMLIAERFFGVFFFMTFRHIFICEFWRTAVIYSGKWRLATILSFGAIWLTATYSAASFDSPLYNIAGNDDLALYYVFDWPQYIQRRVLTDRYII
jgi:hypothetical protein